MRVLLQIRHSGCCIMSNVFLYELHKLVNDRCTGESSEVLKRKQIRQL